MKKDYSVDEMKKIMGQDMEVPKSVDEGMKKRMNSLGFRPREDTTENINFGQVWQRQQY